jgi:hypothetical protein
MATEPEDRLNVLEARLEKLEGSRKDGWDKFQIVATLLIPAAVAFAGYYFSQALADAQAQSTRALTESQTASEERRARSTAAISQAELVATFMKSLLSTDAVERKLAIQAVQLALPEWGPKLLLALETGTGDATTRDEAAVALRQRREKLVEDVYADDVNVRQKATEQLVAGFGEDKLVVEAIAQKAERDTHNANGIYNSALVLKALPSAQLKANEAKVQQFVQIANQGGDKTKALAQQINQKVAQH